MHRSAPTRPMRASVAAGLLLACIAGCQAPTSDGAASGSDSQRRLGTLTFEPCSLPSPMGMGDALEAQCTTYEVPENRDQPDARRIALNIAWIPASNNADTAPDPIVFIAGGPGQSAVDTFPGLAAAFRDAMKHRDVLLVDQRGTGGSNPLPCSEDDAVGLTHDMDRIRDSTLACAKALSAKADLRHYSTTDAVADLEAVRQASGVPRLNLVGVSYGTRVAQQYALRHPQQVRTLTLDSPVPNTVGLGNIHARNLDDALDAQFALCRQNPACSSRMGDPRAELRTLLARLSAEPASVTYRDAGTGEQVTGTLTADIVASLVRMYAYMPAVGALLPQLIHEANQGRHASLMALAMMLQEQMKDAMAMGMQLSVICTEDADSFVSQAADADTVLGNRMPEAMATMCEVWPKGTRPADFSTPLSGSLPVLVLTGEFDPVTPSSYGEQIAATLDNGRWLDLKGQGHNVIGSGCMPKLFTQFIEKADARSLDAACLEQLAYVPPFTTYNGWEP